MPIGRSYLWKSVWFTLRRSGKDKRARSAILAVLVSVLVAIAYLWRFVAVYAHMGDAIPHDRWAIAFYTLLFGSGLLAFLILRRMRGNDDDVAAFSITGGPARRQAVESTRVRDYLYERLLIVASLLARAGSERYLEQHTIPPGAEVITRQLHNTLLREKGVWEKVEPAERDLLIVADGQWTTEQQSRLVAWCEELRLLRWVLRLDAELVPLAHFPSVDCSIAGDVLTGRPLPDVTPLGSWDVRPERDVALAYAARSIAELKARSLLHSGSAPTDWAVEYRAECLGESTDFLAGARTIADLNEQELKTLAAMSCARERYAAYLVEQLGATTPVSFTLWSSEPTA
jgi:hypothetical protein